MKVECSVAELSPSNRNARTKLLDKHEGVVGSDKLMYVTKESLPKRASLSE